MKFLKEDKDTVQLNLQQETQLPLSGQEAAVARLHQRIRACRLCQENGYIPQAHPIVSGRASDPIMVIGQAPGHVSVEKDLPFSGTGGRVLQKWLEQAGFPPGYLHDHCYLTSLTHCDPGKSLRGNGDRKPSPQEVALCRPWLDAEIRLVQPQIILLVGTMAIEAFYGKARLEDIIGSYQERNGRILIPLAHPSGVSRWLNDAEHQKLHQKALQVLSDWRIKLGL